jgi:elongation factor Ts
MDKEKIEAIAEVRRRTGVPVMSCRKALDSNGWDVDKACLNIARTIHDYKAGNGKSHDAYGIVALYSHEFGRVGVMVELGCESGYVAKNNDFIKLANAIAIHIAWSNPKYICRDDVDPREVEAARDNFAETSPEVKRAMLGVPDLSGQLIDGMIDRLFYHKVCLLDQPEMKETQGKETIGALLNKMSLQTGENVSVRRFARFRIGDRGIIMA